MLNMPEDKRRALLSKALELPSVPGVYIMYDALGKIIYVGKSKKLHDRVSQYFTENEKNRKTLRMVSSVRNFDYIICKTEIEALTLENTLIKQHSPRYNIKLKDAKSYPYIKISTGAYPRLSMTRKRSDDGAQYFGPYSGTSTVFSLINEINRIFSLPDCKRNFPKDIGADRPCLYYQMGRCCGVCTGKVSKKEYNDKISCAATLLKGGTAKLRKELEDRMLDYADREMFEAAAGCRDTLKALSKLSEHQKTVTAPGIFRDVAAISEGGACNNLCLLKIRDGAVTDRNDVIISADIPDVSAAALNFLCEYYKESLDIPNEILLGSGFDKDMAELLAEYLSGIRSRKTNCSVPQRGLGKSLCELAEANAKEYALKESRDNARKEQTAEKLALLLGLEVVPERIEAYDISNIGSEHITAGMIVCLNGVFSKKDYRYFRIEGTESQDDYASMREVLRRRLSKLCSEQAVTDSSFSQRPDLLLIDGGAQHLECALEVLGELKLDIPAVGMVKNDEHKTRELITAFGSIDIASQQDIFVFIYRIQEEIHRFTVQKMSEAKRRTVKHSVLEKIEGIGPKKAALLLSVFGGLGRIKNAKPEELSGTPGININDAQNIYNYFHKDTKT